LTARYLLDSNILSDLVSRPDGRVATHLDTLDHGQVCTSIIVAAEMRYGVIRKGSSRLAERVEGVLARVPVISFDPPADEVYGHVRADLERRGTPIGHLDGLIAAHALALGCAVVTANEREFRRVAGLTVENWLR